jgi:hypothetical protein
MDEKSRHVLAAADSWLTALQTLTAAKEAKRGTEVQQLGFDAAEVALAITVQVWRGPG